MNTNNRKSDHLRICAKENVEAASTGFADIRLIHSVLPELDLAQIKTDVTFLGKQLEAPLIIEAITGGTNESKAINEGMAQVAAKFGIGFGVGSQRAAIDDPKLSKTFSVRNVAADVLLIANLGAVQLNYGYGLDECEKSVEMIDADALALHVNPLQEAIQPEGDVNFENLIPKINDIAKQLSVPLIVKGVGSGISKDVAEKLNVAAFDVGGVGGTSWSLVEGYRCGTNIGVTFAEWGIPTAECVKELAALDVPLIASGGIRTGVDIAKAIALGAEAAGMALPLYKAWESKKSQGLEQYISQVIQELRISMFLTSSGSVEELSGKIKE